MTVTFQLSSFKESKIFLSSTAKGLNHWYKIWTEAIQKRNGYNPIRVYWQDVPGRDEAWKTNEIAKTSELSFAQEQDCSFLGSALTLISGKYIANLTFQEPIKIPTNLNVHERYHKHIKLYELPKPKHTYALGLDSSEMQEDSTSDSISLQILDITTFPFVQVGCMLIREGINYLEVPEPVVEFAKFYNTGYIFVEQNSTGLEIANKIVDEFEYENIFYQKGNLPGYKTSRKTKKLGCSNLKLLIENQRLIINDFDTISQIGTFIKSGTSYKADKTYKDDAVMALIGAIFFMQVKDFEGFDEANLDYAKGILQRTQEDSESQEPTILVVLPEMGDYMDQPTALPSEWAWLFN